MGRHTQIIDNELPEGREVILVNLVFPKFRQGDLQRSAQ